MLCKEVGLPFVFKGLLKLSVKAGIWPPLLSPLTAIFDFESDVVALGMHA